MIKKWAAKVAQKLSNKMYCIDVTWLSSRVTMFRNLANEDSQEVFRTRVFLSNQLILFTSKSVEHNC